MLWRRYGGGDAWSRTVGGNAGVDAHARLC